MDVPLKHGKLPIVDVREGMEVLDSTGELVGTVVKVVRPDAAHVASDSRTERARGASGFLGAVADVLAGGEKLPDADRERLLRDGFVRIDTGAIIHRDKYADARQIAQVVGDFVHLSIARDQLVS